MNDMRFDPKTHCYVDVRTGEVVPSERIWEHAAAKLERAIERLAVAWLRLRGRA